MILPTVVPSWCSCMDLLIHYNHVWLATILVLLTVMQLELTFFVMTTCFILTESFLGFSLIVSGNFMRRIWEVGFRFVCMFHYGTVLIVLDLVTDRGVRHRFRGSSLAYSVVCVGIRHFYLVHDFRVSITYVTWWLAKQTNSVLLMHLFHHCLLVHNHGVMTST